MWKLRFFGEFVDTEAEVHGEFVDAEAEVHGEMESMWRKSIIWIPKTASLEGENQGNGIYTQKFLNKIPNIEENWNP